jgi:hypothetical protein
VLVNGDSVRGSDDETAEASTVVPGVVDAVSHGLVHAIEQCVYRKACCPGIYWPLRWKWIISSGQPSSHVFQPRPQLRCHCRDSECIVDVVPTMQPHHDLPGCANQPEMCSGLFVA